MTDHTGSAKALMNNEAFKEAIAKTQQSYLNAAMACPMNDSDGQRLNLQAARIVATVGAHIAALASNTSGDVIELPDFYAERARKKFMGIL